MKHGDPVAALEQLVDSGATRGVKSVCVWLGGSVCRVTTCEAVQGARDRTEEEAALTGALRLRKVAQDDEAARMVASIPATSQLVVALVSQPVLDQIDALRSARSLNVRSVRPWWSAGLALRGADESKGDVALAAFDDEALVLLSFDADGALRDARSHASVDTPDEAQRSATRWSMALGGNVPICVWLRDTGVNSASRPPAAGIETFAFADQLVRRETF